MVILVHFGVRFRRFEIVNVGDVAFCSAELQRGLVLGPPWALVLGGDRCSFGSQVLAIFEIIHLLERSAPIWTPPVMAPGGDPCSF